MNGLEFIATIIGSLAWPVAVVALVMLLREPVQKLLLDLRRFRYGDMEVDFGKEVRELEAKARTAGLKLPKPAGPETQGPKDFGQIIADASRLASDFPEPAVGLAWTAVEHELMQAVKRLAISADYPPYNSPMKNINLLQEQGHIDADTRALLDRMRNLRNAAVHSSRSMGPITPDEARAFIALSEAVTDQLKRITR
jgi:hypothetical protein